MEFRGAHPRPGTLIIGAMLALFVLAGCKSRTLGDALGDTPLMSNRLEQLGFERIGALPKLPWLNFERVGWLFSAQTGKLPNYPEFIRNGEYMQKAGRQIPAFCNLTRLRQAVCQYMKTDSPKYIDEYERISKEEILSLAGKTEFLMNGAEFKRLNPYDPVTHNQLIEYSGVRGGIVLGTGCWFSYSEKAPHACINIDNIKAVNKASLAISENTAKYLRENQTGEDFALVMKVRLRSGFSLTELYTRSKYTLFADASLYTAWVVVTNIYLVDQKGFVYADIAIADGPSEKDRIDRELATQKAPTQNNPGRRRRS